MTDATKEASGGRVAPAGDRGEAPPMFVSGREFAVGLISCGLMVLLSDGQWMALLGAMGVGVWCFTRGHTLGWIEHCKKGSTR